MGDVSQNIKGLLEPEAKLFEAVIHLLWRSDWT